MNSALSGSRQRQRLRNYAVAEGGYITFKYAPGAETETQAPYCGQQARLDLVKFPLAVKLPTNNHSCNE
jgi:hypothetical protein